MNRFQGDGLRLPDQRMIPRRRPSSRAVAAPAAAFDSPQTEGHVVRPCVLTGGRTRTLVDGLRIESMISALPAALEAPLRFESGQVVRACQRSRSLAEIASALAVPVGVAKVIVGDLMTEGYVSVQSPGDVEVAALERIRELVRSL